MTIHIFIFLFLTVSENIHISVTWLLIMLNGCLPFITEGSALLKKPDIPMAKYLNSLWSTFLVLSLGLTGTMMKLSGELQFHLMTASKGSTFIFFPCWNEDKPIKYFNGIQLKRKTWCSSETDLLCKSLFKED